MDDFWYDISQLWVGTFFYGIYLVLFCICIYILLHRPRDSGNIVLLVTAIALFTLATVQTAINLILGAADIDGIEVPYDNLSLADMMIYVVNNVIADALVIYRCYSVWNRNIYVIILPVILLITTSGKACTAWVRNDAKFSSAGRIWWICRKARAYLKTDTQRRYVSTIAIVVESGVMYSAAVSTYLILGAIPSASIVQEPVMEMLTQLVGIVPTLIIVRVGLGVSVQSVEASVKTATTLSDSLPHKHHILGTTRPSPQNIVDKDPSIPYDVEKGNVSREVGKPQLSEGELPVASISTVAFVSVPLYRLVPNTIAASPRRVASGTNPFPAAMRIPTPIAKNAVIIAAAPKRVRRGSKMAPRSVSMVGMSQPIVVPAALGARSSWKAYQCGVKRPEVKRENAPRNKIPARRRVAGRFRALLARRGVVGVDMMWLSAGESLTGARPMT
ncbi:hypothetical protein B0H13DRAFT_1901022 [Mycena leptocephala]|nr:hypothetical protein B0H13DRAFT_1901022 [Mycena leptocephala]